MTITTSIGSRLPVIGLILPCSNKGNSLFENGGTSAQIQRKPRKIGSLKRELVIRKSIFPCFFPVNWEQAGDRSY